MTFLQPTFLIALAALAVPIALHLMSRDVPRLLRFPTIRHILKGQQVQAGRRGIRNWLTLLSRLLLLALVVLLFANPVRPADAPAVTPRSSAEVAILVDLSASMSASAFAPFVATAVAEITAAHPGAPVALVASAGDIVREARFPNNETTLAAVTAELEPQLVAGDHDAALRLLPSLFSDRPGVHRVVYILSDLQKQDWSTDRLPAVGESYEFVFKTPPHAGADNLAITRAVPEVFTRGESRRLRATVQVRNFAVAPATARLTVRAGAQAVHRDIELRGEHSEKFVIDLDNVAVDIASAELTASEPYHADNRYHFWIGPQAPYRVALLGNAEHDIEARQGMFFVGKALGITLPGAPRIELRAGPPELIWEEDLSTFDCIFLFDAMTGYGSEDMHLLQQYAAAGGTLVYVCGQRAADNIARLRDAGMTGARFRGYQGDLSQFRVHHVETVASGYPAVALFAREPSDLRVVPIFKTVRLNAGPKAVALLALGDGTPLLLREPVENGLLFTLACSLSARWSELPTALSFLPLVHQLVQVGGADRSRGVLEATVGELATAQLAAAGILPDAEVPAAAGVHIVAGVPIEQNVTRAESDLRPADAFTVSRQLANAGVAAGPVDAVATASASSGAPLRPVLAWLLLAVLALELFAANLRLPRSRSVAQPAR
jgi:hypothetical protein